MATLDSIASAGIYGFFLVFLRVGAAVMLLPGLGELSVPPRIRLMVALALSLALLPLLPGGLAGPPDQPAELLRQFAMELAAGGFIGATARIIFAAVQVAGQVIGQSAGLATIFPAAGIGFEGGSPVSTLLVMGAVAMVFAADLHYLMIESLVLSYSLFPATAAPDWGDSARLMTDVVARSFLLGVQFAAPFLILSFLFNVGLGLTNRMMQALPVFFIGMPFLLAGGLLLLFATVGAVLLAQADEMARWLSTLQV